MLNFSNTFHTLAQLHQRQTWVKRIRQQERMYKIVVQKRQQQYANLLGLATPKASNLLQTLLKYTNLRDKCIVLHTLLIINIKSLPFFGLNRLPFVVNTRSHFLMILLLPSVIVTSIAPTTLGFKFWSTTTARN